MAWKGSKAAHCGVLTGAVDFHPSAFTDPGYGSSVNAPRSSSPVGLDLDACPELEAPPRREDQSDLNDPDIGRADQSFSSEFPLTDSDSDGCLHATLLQTTTLLSQNSDTKNPLF